MGELTGTKVDNGTFGAHDAPDTPDSPDTQPYVSLVITAASASRSRHD